MSHNGCACGDDWVFYSCNLATGTIRAVLHPISIDWQETLNGIGTGTITLATREVILRDIWPHLTSLYIARLVNVLDPDVGPEGNLGMYGAIVESVEASDDGTTKVGFSEISNYLASRTIYRGVRYTDQPQTAIGADIVNTFSQPNGIPLRAIADTSVRTRDREWTFFDQKVVLEAITELTQVVNGPDWEMRYLRGTGGVWTAYMIFRDRAGGESDIILRSDVNVSSYGISVDTQNHTTRVVGLGEGEAPDQLTSIANATDSPYPRFDSTQSWSDVKRQRTLDNNTEGYLADNEEPSAIPSVTLRGFDPDPALLQLGDSVEVHVDFGAVTFHGRARIVAISWSLTAGEPETRKLEMSPIDPPSQSMLNQVPGEPLCPVCAVAP